MFWKTFFHQLSHSAISHAKVNYALNSYLLMSVKTKHRIGPERFVRFGV